MSQPKKRKYYVVRKTIATILVTILIAALLVAGFALNMLKDMIDDRPTMDLNLLETTESTLVYDADGELFAELALKLSDNIAYDDLPNVVIDAFISIEDAKFFSHDGFDLARFANESIQTVLRFLRGGGFGAGASTITMQTIKNSFFTTEESLADESIERKAQEISLAMDLEEIVDKETILEYYLNKINFGVPQSRGIAKAALYYFNKEVSELNLSEAAYLAGVINSPNNLNAYTNIEAGTERRNLVLSMMLRHGYITEDEFHVASEVKLENQLWGAEKYYGDTQPHQEYLDAVIDELVNVYNIDPYTQGIKVYTSLDKSQQELVESIEDGVYGGYFDHVIDGAYVTLNHTNGQIVAIGGGRKFEGDESIARGFNNALQLTRQPGSVLKPVVPYALAFEHLGYSTQHVIEDGPYAYIGSPVFVYNYGQYMHGDVTLLDAISGSLNIPSLKTMDELLIGSNAIGYERMAEYLVNLGFDYENAQYVNSAYAIGGGLFNATPLQIAAAHATIMNGGKYIQPHTITRIEIEGRDPILPDFEPVEAISEQAAYLAASTMRYAVEGNSNFYTAARQNRTNFPVYAKTGTSDHGDEFAAVCGIPDGATKDSWHAASTSELTHVAWTGYKTFCNNGEGQAANYIYDPLISSDGLAMQINLMIQNSPNISTVNEIPRPQGITNITHVLGVYPYASPVENMDETYIVNGMIIDRFSRLTTLETQTLDSLSSQNVEIVDFTKDGLELKVTLADYPDPDKLKVAEETKIMSATNSLGETRSYRGKRAFDPSWIYGAVQYATEVRLNGNVVETLNDDQAERTILVKDVKSNQNLQVCSFYTWEKNEEGKSNEICQTINSGSQKVEMPNFVGQMVEDAQQWIRENTSAGITLRQQNPNSLDDVGKIISISPDYSDAEVTQETLDRANFTITYYDGEITNLQSYVGRPVSTLVNDLSKFFTLVGPTQDTSAIVDSVTVNNQAVNSVAIRPNTQIVFTIRNNSNPDNNNGNND